MKLKFILSFILTNIVFFNSINGAQANHIFGLFVRPYPLIEEIGPDFLQHKKDKLSAHLNNPSKLSEKILETSLDPHKLDGIYATYKGYMTLSNLNGLIFFPKQGELKDFNILITPRIIPVPMFFSTIHHWEIAANESAKMYDCTVIKNEETNTYLLNVEETPVPANKRIPIDAIVLIGKPENFYVQVGTHILNDTNQLILPDVFFKKGYNSVVNSLEMLKIRHLFSTQEKRSTQKDNVTATIRVQ